MDTLKSRLEELVHAAYVARIGTAINETVAEAVFAGHRPWIEASIAAAIAETTGGMDEFTRERYAAFVLERLDRDLGQPCTGTADPLSDALAVRIEVYGERRP